MFEEISIFKICLFIFVYCCIIIRKWYYFICLLIDKLINVIFIYNGILFSCVEGELKLLIEKGMFLVVSVLSKIIWI